MVKRMTKRTIVLVAALLWLGQGAAFAQSAAKDTPAKVSDRVSAAASPEASVAAARLLRATDLRARAEEQFASQIAAVMGSIQQNQPEMPGRAFDILEEELEATAPKMVARMLETVTTAYIERFTPGEMNAIAAFYETAVGQKALRQMGALANTGEEQGRIYGQKLGRLAADRAMARIRAEGVVMRPKR